MLNIGRLGPDAAEYYLGEIATSPEAYYTGGGESPGRWIGSLSPALGLSGEVAPADLRAVLAGRHPVTGEQLVVRQATESARRAQGERLPLHDERYDLARAASRLRLSARQVRRLLWAGERAGPGTATPHLVGERSNSPMGTGRPTWFVARSELERFEATTATRRGRTGFDLTLRPAKSVSVLWALAPDDVRVEIRQAHREAVDAVIAHLERHALVSRRRTKDGVDAIGADGFVAAAFDHRTSRAGDPLLHTHVVTANLTRTVDGRWRALDARPIYDHARPAGVLYQAHLRKLLTERLGIDWEGVRNGWAEVKGVPSHVIRAFSKRRDEIEEIVAESGYSSARAQQAATLASRRSKDHTARPEALVDGWRREAAALEFGDDAIASCLGRIRDLPNADTERILDDIASPAGLTKHASSFSRGDVIEAIAERSAATLDAESIDLLADRFLASPRVVPLHSPAKSELVWRRAGAFERDVDRMLFTTPDLVRMEDDLLDWAGDDRAGAIPISAEQVAATLARYSNLSDEQAAMVRGLASSTAAIDLVAGRPGAGKTTAIAAYVDLVTGAGRTAVGCSVAATAAAELERSCRFGERTGRPASTVARLLVELDRRPLLPGTVVVVDEASMIGTRDLHRLVRHAFEANGSLVLVGDPDQHGAVETGGVFRALVARSPHVHTLVANNRQSEERDRRVIELFREGNVEAALSRYDDAGLVVRSATARVSYDRIVADWWEHARAGSRDPMIVGTNHARCELNSRARRCLQHAGLVSGPGVDGCDGAPLSAGDWVVARRNDRSVRNRAGDGVLNGDIGRVLDVDPEAGTIVVGFDRIGEVTLPPRYVRNHVQHAYARTTYGVQGATLDRAFVHVDDRTGFEEGYVAMTRGRLETRLYLVDGTARDEDEASHRAHVLPDTGLDTVAESMQRRRAGVMAHDVDPLATAVLATAGSDLASLRRERRRLEAILRQGPADVSEALHGADAARNAVRTALAAHRLGGTRRTARLEAALDRHTNRVRVLRSRHTARQEFLAEHAADVDALRVVRRAELAREAQVRAAARISPPEQLRQLMTGDPIADRAIVDAAEAVAVHAERFGGIVGESSVDQLLGDAPRDGEARLSHARASALVRDAQGHEVAVFEHRPVPTLFD